MRGLNVAWNRPREFRLAVLLACRNVDGAAAAASGPPKEEETPLPVPEDDRRECWWCQDGSRSGLGARDCARDGTWLALLLVDRLDGAVSGGLAMSRCVVSMGEGALF